MWLFYVDEYGDDKVEAQDPTANPLTLKKGSSAWFVLTAVGIPAHSRITLADQMRMIKDRHFPGWRNRPWKDTEIKGRHLKRAVSLLEAGKRPDRDGYKHLTLAGAKILCGDLGWIFQKYNPIVYAVAVDKKALLQKGTSHSALGVSYTYLQQRLALMAEGILGPTEGIIIVADEQSGHEKAFKSGEFHKTRKALSNALHTQPNFDLLLDKPVWVNAELSDNEREIIQMPDIVAYTAATACMTKQCPPECYYLWDEIAACMARNWKTRKLPAGGFTIYPRPSSYPRGM